MPSAQRVTPADGADTWHIDARPGADTLPEEVFRLCAERDWPLTQLTPFESSLEDVFRALTEGNLKRKT